MKNLTFALTILFSPFSIACKCGDFDLSRQLEHADKAYIGTIINAQVIGSGDRMSATLKVSEKFVGEVFDMEEVITNDTSCSVRFILKAEYLVFEDENGQVNQCTMPNLDYRRMSLKDPIETLRQIKQAGI